MKVLVVFALLAVLGSAAAFQINLEDLFGGGGGGGFFPGDGGEHHDEHAQEQHAPSREFGQVFSSSFGDVALPLHLYSRQSKLISRKARGYPCKTGDIVGQPRDCPCPMFRMTKCALGDWYICVPFGSKVRSPPANTLFLHYLTHMLPGSAPTKAHR
jgi:hypothetical protein